jgi:fucose permease
MIFLEGCRPMPQPFRRTPHTWLLYLIFAIFGYVINALGPVTPFLKAELHLSYTVNSLIFSAFAAGIILTGLVGNLAVRRLGQRRVIWLGLFGMCLSAVGLAAAQTAWMTIAAAFFTGCIGALMPSVIPSSLADEHGEQRSVALSENNLIAAISSAAAPLMVGWLSFTWLGWRAGLVVPLLAAAVLWFIMGRRVTIADSAAAAQAAASRGKKLPPRYWVFWTAIILANAIEYCMLFWCADYLVNVVGLPKSIAAQGGSLFLAGMILGRLAGSRLVLRFSAYQLVTASILVAAAGFSLFWIAATPWMPLAGLFLTGLGVANQFPLILSLALGAAEGNTVQASTRTSLASGIAIFTLPLVLGWLADVIGIRLAYGLIGLLLAAALVIILSEARQARLTAAHPA